MPHAYIENQLVEKPVIGLFAAMGWTTVSALEEVFDSAEPSPRPSPSERGGWLGRETKSEIILSLNSARRWSG